ncbi:hypothetical protein THOM_2445 [Trachipleistophora hominis]|uniref:Uncharacterized protein n=1 Tax=Trachipleistophora hominis TaxID=72359 RepID=L7JSS8_TRAHO|nr:hypothetical protein THOM_2445 [Trachipleistophora hominis]
MFFLVKFSCPMTESRSARGGNVAIQMHRKDQTNVDTPSEKVKSITEQQVKKVIAYFDTKKIRNKRFKKCIRYLKRLPSDIDENLDVIFVKIFKLHLSDDEKCYLYSNMVDLIFLMDEPMLIADKVHNDASSKQKYSFLACKCLFILIAEYNFCCLNFFNVFMEYIDQQITENTEDTCEFIIQIVNRICLSFADVTRLVTAMKQYLLSLSSSKTYALLNAIRFIVEKHVLLHERFVKGDKFWELDVLEHSIEPIKCLAQAIKYKKERKYRLNRDEQAE